MIENPFDILKNTLGGNKMRNTRGIHKLRNYIHRISNVGTCQCETLKTANKFMKFPWRREERTIVIGQSHLGSDGGSDWLTIFKVILL